MNEVMRLFVIGVGVWLILFLTLLIIALYMLGRKMFDFSEKLDAVRRARQDEKAAETARFEQVELSVTNIVDAINQLLDVLSTSPDAEVTVSVKKKRNGS